jgi:hypothetical protein
MPIDVGGLGLNPLHIGYIIGSCGMFNGLFQAICFHRIHRCLGERFIFVTGMSLFLLVFSLFPVISVHAQRFGLTVVVWLLIAVILASMTFMEMCYGALVVGVFFCMLGLIMEFHFV